MRSWPSTASTALSSSATRRPGLPLHKLVPWFIIGFLGLTRIRSFGLVPHAVLCPTSSAASLLIVVSMAALGLGTDLRMAARAGGRVTAVVMLSLLVLGLLSLALIRLLGVA